jgi:hypothetical protein
VGEEDVCYLQDEMVKVKFFLALSRGTCGPFQLSIFPFRLYQTTRQDTSSLTKVICLQRLDIELFEEKMQLPNVSCVARKHELGAEFATPY